MKLTRTERIDRITAGRFEVDEQQPVVNNFHPRYHMTPTMITVEFNRDEPDWRKAGRSASITGQRYQTYADGTVRKVAGTRGHAATEPTTWTWPSGVQAMPQALVDLIGHLQHYRTT
jgi:hypothetical protein